MDQARRSDDASIPLFHKHAYRLKVLKPQHQLALLGVVLLHNVVGHVQRMDTGLAMSSRRSV